MTEEKTEPNSDPRANGVSVAPRITNTQKEKDPRRVEAGKKLGAVSKMAKNQKKYKAEAHEAEAQSLNNNNSDYSAFFYSGLAAVVVGCLGTLYWFTKKPPDAQEASRSVSEVPDAPGPKFRTSVTQSNLISLDD